MRPRAPGGDGRGASHAALLVGLDARRLDRAFVALGFVVDGIAIFGRRAAHRLDAQRVELLDHGRGLDGFGNGGAHSLDGISGRSRSGERAPALVARSFSGPFSATPGNDGNAANTTSTWLPTMAGTDCPEPRKGTCEISSLSAIFMASIVR